MSSDPLIQYALLQFVLFRSAEELIKEFGTPSLNFDKFRQLVEVVDPTIPTQDVKQFYLKTITKYQSPHGITPEVYQQIVDDQEFASRADYSNSYESLPLLKNIMRGFREKKMPIKRLYNFYDKNKDQQLQDPEFRSLLEFFYVAITDSQFKTLRDEFPDQPLSLDVVSQLFQKWQEIVYENSKDDPQVVLQTPQTSGNLLTVPKPQQISMALVQEEDERFQDFMGVDFKIPGVKELADLLKRSQQTQESFTDSEFPPNIKSLGVKFSANQWKRLSEIHNGQQKVFSVDTQHDKSNTGLNKWISHRDICQGDLGDCYFMSTLSSIACKWPNQIKDLFPIQRANKFGVYGVRLCLNGEWQCIKVDDFIPVRNGLIAFTKNADKEIWVSLLEKSWAKVNGSYTNIDAGDPREVIKTITGGPTWLLTTNKPTFKDNFINCVKAKCIMVTGTYGKNADYSAVGLEPGHAYSILNVKTVQHPTRGQVHLLKIRNPWARKEWKGDWGDDSDLWTPELREQAGNTGKENDGIFFMSLDDYSKYFYSVFCGYFKQDYFYNSLKCNAKRNKGLYFQFEIKDEGEYFFAVHQESTRLYRSQPELKYEYSYVRLLLVKETHDGYEYIEGKNSKDIETHVGRVGEKFTPGKYILYIKIKWHVQSWVEHPFVLSVYGEQFVQIKQIPRDPNLVPQTMTYLAKNNRKTEEVLPDVVMRMDTNGSLGIGYIHYKNESHQQINFETDFVNKGSCKLSKPERGYYFKSYLPPQGEKLVTFTITPPITELSLPTLGHKLL